VPILDAMQAISIRRYFFHQAFGVKGRLLEHLEDPGCTVLFGDGRVDLAIGVGVDESNLVV
jgi:hypothetical protein